LSLEKTRVENPKFGKIADLPRNEIRETERFEHGDVLFWFPRKFPENRGPSMKFSVSE
jgi:hypothetical protein